MFWRRFRTVGGALGLLLLLAGTGASRADEILIRGLAVAEEGGALDKATARLFMLPSRRDEIEHRLAGEEAAPVAEAKVTPDGSFVLAAPSAGMWRLVVEAPDRLPMAFELIPLIEERTVPELELPARQTLEVRVVDAAGEPVAGAWVRAAPTRTGMSFGPFRRRGRGWRPAERLARPDADGRVTLYRQEDEKLTLRAGAPGRVESEELETLGDSATLRLAAGTPLTVRAVDRRGTALGGVLGTAGEGGWPVAADEEGLIDLTVPSDGKLELWLSDADGRHYSGSLTAGAAGAARGDEPVERELAEPRRLAGRVIDEDSRRTVAGALVWPTSEPAAFLSTDGRGAFDLAVAEAGEVWLLAARSGYQSGSLSVAERSPHEPVIALSPATRVRGVVVDAGGRPVAKAEVGVKRADAPRGRMIFTSSGRSGSAGTRSDEKGRFVLTGLEPGTGYSAFARHPDFARGETALAELEPLATIDGVRIVLDTGASLVGRTLDQGGVPVAGARIILTKAAGGGMMRRFRTMGGSGDEDSPEAYSDNDGAFEFRHLADGSFDLEVTAGGFAKATVPSVEVSAESGAVDAGAIVLAPGVELAGRVVDAAGRPIEEAEVWAMASNAMNAMRMRFGRGDGDPEATTAADGHFTLADRLPGERVDLLVRRTGYSAGTLSGVEVPPVAPVEVVLKPASNLSGKVIDSGGEPVAEARIQAFAEGGGATSGGAVFMMSVAGFATSDEEGEFTLEDIEPGTVRLGVSARGFRETEISNIEVPTGEDVEGLEIELLEGASLSGRVRAANGRPLAGARVHTVERQRRMGYMGGFGATTDGDGNYFLEGLEPGTRLIGASHDEEGEVTREVEIEPGENLLDLVFEGGVEVTGRVVDEGGAPLAGAMVFINSSSQRFLGGSEVTTSTDGSFTLTGVRDGTYHVTALKEGFAQPPEGSEIEVAGAPVYGVEVRLGAAGVIRGEIRGLDPGQLVAVSVYASSPPRRFMTGEVRHDGTYQIPDVGPGDWSVEARTSDGSAQARGRVTLEPGQPEALLDLEFGAGLRVTGRVLLGAEPVAGISVGLRGIDVQSNASGVTGRDGRFSITGIEPGRHQVAVMDFGSGLQHSEEHDITSDRDLVIELSVSRVSGRVVDGADSSPIAGAVVRLEPVGDEDDYRRFFNRGGTTDAAGAFNIHNISAGGYRLVAEKDGYATAELAVQIEPDRSLQDLELELQPTEGLALRVFLPSGRPARQVWVAALDPAGQSVVAAEYTVDQEGRLRLSTVPPGSWTLHVGTRGTAVSSLVAVAPGNAGDVRLLPEARLELLIPELAEDRSFVTVEAFGADGRAAATFSWIGRVEHHWRGSQGRVTLSGLAPGVWRIRATVPDGRVWDERVTLVAGDNPTLEMN